MTSTSDILRPLLARKEAELEAENKRVMEMIAECKRDHVILSKDYWLRQHALQTQVKLLRQLIEETNE